jgi:hypothetical protein
MSLASKFQIPEGKAMQVINAPGNLKLDIPTSKRESGVLLLLARNSKILNEKGGGAFKAAREDKLVWIAYPKAGQLETDLNRDILVRLVEAHGLQPVRQISIDNTWSALRFRPA